MFLSRLGNSALTVVNPLRHLVPNRMPGIISLITAIGLTVLTHQIVSQISWRWDISLGGLKNALLVSLVFFSVLATLGYTAALQTALICAVYKLLYTKAQTENLPLSAPTSVEIDQLKMEKGELEHRLETITWEAGVSKEETARIQTSLTIAREERDQETKRCAELRTQHIRLEEEIRSLKNRLLTEQEKQATQGSKAVKIELHLSDSYKKAMACLNEFKRYMEERQEMPDIDPLVAVYKDQKEMVHNAVQRLIDAEREGSEMRVLLESLLRISDDLEGSRTIFEFLGTIYTDRVFSLPNQNLTCRTEVLHGQ